MGNIVKKLQRAASHRGRTETVELEVQYEIEATMNATVQNQPLGDPNQTCLVSVNNLKDSLQKTFSTKKKKKKKTLRES